MLKWEIIESQVCKDTLSEVQYNLDSNLVPTLQLPIQIPVTVPSYSNTPDSIIERQLPVVSTSLGMILIASQPLSLFNDAAHNTSPPLLDSSHPPLILNQQPLNPPEIMKPVAAPPPSGMVTRYILQIFSDVDMADCKGFTTPMCSSSPAKADDGSPLADATLYQRTFVYAIPESGVLESSKKGSSISQGILNIVSENLSPL
ncbi:hypothetical protein KY284_020338 [Solanum tuberosum]|nr:hypothetical protein KY284_020338 [Solanum tuberosum]